MIGADLSGLLYIAANLRDGDREELSATRDPANFESLAVDAYLSPYKKMAVDRGGLPCFAFGARPLHPGTVSLWGFGTEEYKDAILEVTKYIQRFMIPTLLDQGVHRGQCLVHPNNRASQDWLAALDFKREATLSGFGSRREDMFLYAWVADVSRH